MDSEQHRHLKIVGRGAELPENGRKRNPAGQSRSGESWKSWADKMWSEVARVHSLMDKVSAEMPDRASEQPADSIRVLETDAALRVLQAYYKGLRFAIDSQKDFANGQ
jgi:hypothetical protein